MFDLRGKLSDILHQVAWKVDPRATYYPDVEAGDMDLGEIAELHGRHQWVLGDTKGIPGEHHLSNIIDQAAYQMLESGYPVYGVGRMILINDGQQPNSLMLALWVGDIELEDTEDDGEDEEEAELEV